MATIKDISKRCGVSPATVSKALNGYGDISEETKQKILAAATELHYTPNAAARQLKTNTSHNIGVVFVDQTGSGLAHEYFSQILDSAKAEAEKRGYDITFISENVGYGSYLEHCRYRNCDGVLVVSDDFTTRQIQELINSDVPTVIIDYVFDNHSSILSDNMDGKYLLTKYLIERGHTKIAYIHGEITSVTNKRLSGFYKACMEAGIRIPDDYMITAKFHDPDSSAEATKQLMRLKVPPTAIMYPDDYSYLGGLRMLEKLGISIPDVVSVVGYDGIGLSQVIRPRLTTYYQNAPEIGRRSAEKLIETIEHRKSCIPEAIRVSGKLLEGQTVRDLTAMQ